MLLIIHKKAYQDFLNLLLQLETQTHNGTLEINAVKNKAIWTDLTQIFQQRILSLTDENLETEVANRWISIQREIQREFRLLNTDWLFLISSRKSATKEAREQKVLAHLRKLIGYCQMVQKLLEEKKS